MIPVTDEMETAYDDAAWENPVELGGLEMANVRAGLEAVLPIAERDLVARVEGKRGAGLCDCDGADDGPTNPRTGDPMEHHCDCAAVTAAGMLLGDRRKTRHVAECTCDWDEP